VTGPFLLLLLDYWPLARLKAETGKKLALEKLPFLGLAVLSSIVTFAAQQQGGAVRSLVQFTFSTRLENAMVAYVRYLGKMIWPADLAIFYPHPGNWPTATVVGAVVVLMGVTALALGLRRRAPFLLVGWLWYLGTLVPVIGLVQVGEQAIADRYTYVPLLGIFIAAAWGVGELLGRLPRSRFIGYGLMLPLVGLCALLSRNQLLHWREDETLFRHALTVTRNNPLAHNNLADALLAKGRAAEAIPHYRETIRLNPSYAHAYNNLGTALVALNQIDEAREQFRAAAKLDVRFVEPRMNLADMEAAANRMDEAVRLYNEALQIAPKSIPIRLKVSQALTRAGQSDQAIRLLLGIIEEAPDAPAAHYYLGRTLVLKGDLKLGAMSFQAALRLDPSLAPAHLNLAETLSRLGEYDDAGLHFQEALRLDPAHADTRYAYGKFLAGRGLIDQARQQFEEALLLAPGHKAASEQLEATRSR
jgi:tetratricopeptide (TPR) repeat protein